MGHLGIALGAKGMRPEVSLLLLSTAAVAPDLIDLSLQGAGRVDGAGLWTHSLLAAALSSLAVFVAYRATTRNTAGAALVAIVTASHLLADLITSHMVLWPGGKAYGLHLYLHRWGDLTLECAVIVAGWLLYTRTLPSARRHSPTALGIPSVLLATQSLVAILNVS